MMFRTESDFQSEEKKINIFSEKIKKINIKYFFNFLKIYIIINSLIIIEKKIDGGACLPAEDKIPNLEPP
jgi:F0F1-type ATP synthase delta subunit